VKVVLGVVLLTFAANFVARSAVNRGYVDSGLQTLIAIVPYLVGFYGTVYALMRLATSRRTPVRTRVSLKSTSPVLVRGAEFPLDYGPNRLLLGQDVGPGNGREDLTPFRSFRIDPLWRRIFERGRRVPALAFALSQSVALPGELEDGTVVNESVDHRGRGHFVGKYLRPLLEC